MVDLTVDSLAAGPLGPGFPGRQAGLYPGQAGAAQAAGGPVPGQAGLAHLHHDPPGGSLPLVHGLGDGFCLASWPVAVFSYVLRLSCRQF